MRHNLSPVSVLAVSGLILSVIGCKPNPTAARSPDGSGPLQGAIAATNVSATERVVELDHGCKLAIDGKLSSNDLVTRQIERESRRALSRVQTLMAANDLTIHVKLSDKSSEGYILPELGVGGCAEGTNSVWVFMQPQNPQFNAGFVGRGLPHEIHHAIRMRQPNWRLSLLEVLVMEGLADHFVVEVLGGKPGPWTHALTDEQIQEYLIRAKPYLRVKTESYAELVEKCKTWLTPSGSKPMPKRAGYSFGWWIVENYLRAHPKARAWSLVQESAEAIASATPGML
jgi:uncharacterized protein YjaZ